MTDVAPALRILLLLCALLALSCNAQRSPEETVQSAIIEAHERDLEGFLEHFDRESRGRLGMFWATSQRYGYLEADSLEYLNELEVLASEPVTQAGTSWTKLTVTDGNRQGLLCLRLEQQQWRIALGQDSPCGRKQ
jgi:hypothetical protein